MTNLRFAFQGSVRQLVRQCRPPFPPFLALTEGPRCGEDERVEIYRVEFPADAELPSKVNQLGLPLLHRRGDRQDIDGAVETGHTEWVVEAPGLHELRRRLAAVLNSPGDVVVERLDRFP